MANKTIHKYRLKKGRPAPSKEPTKNGIIVKHSGQTITAEDVTNVLEGNAQFKGAIELATKCYQEGGWNTDANAIKDIAAVITSATAPLEQRIKELENRIQEDQCRVIVRIKELERALEFYGNEANWRMDDMPAIELIRDLGAIARAALGKEK